jgi:hypothetical protein
MNENSIKFREEITTLAALVCVCFLLIRKEYFVHTSTIAQEHF